MADDRIKKYEPFFGKWKLGKEIHRNFIGSIYEIHAEQGDQISALKYMHVPSLAEFVKEEIHIMRQCKDHPNIVSYENHRIIECLGSGESGWDILLQMERLYPIQPHLSNPEATQYDVIKMWLDIANALRYCESLDIVHRNIKPSNIMISTNGEYKLIGFDLAKQCAGNDLMLSGVAGTERWMAPEIYRRKQYDKRVDYYSLGCVIYYFLNFQRPMFCLPYPRTISPMDMEKAHMERMSGKKVPPIRNVSKSVNEVLLKSLSPIPEERYKSAEELYQAVKQILDEQSYDLSRKLIAPV